MPTTLRPTAARDREYERIFAGDRCVCVTHFYSLGDFGSPDLEFFAVGYWTHVDCFVHGVVYYDGESFETAGLSADCKTVATAKGQP